VSVFERFTEPADRVIELACEEAERLRHDYLGPEHVLAGLARMEDSHAAVILRSSGLDAEVLRAGLDRLVAQGILPERWRNKSDLLSGLGVDLDAVQRAIEQSFGADAVCAAHKRVLRRPSRREDLLICTNPLNGKAMLAKRAFYLAGKEAGALGQHGIAPEHLLLGVLRDALDPVSGGWRSRRLRRIRAYLGLPGHGPSPVRLMIEACGTTPQALRDKVLAELHATT
jgi:ATP-dependent Clp protease ATP-binding subunit ClpA